jgi:hypothetical protein
MQISYDVTNSSQTLSSRGASFLYSHFVSTDQLQLIAHETALIHLHLRIHIPRVAANLGRDHVSQMQSWKSRC